MKSDVEVKPGDRFERLLVISQADRHPKHKGKRWHCKCDCGADRVVYGYALRTGNTRSCGCIRKGMRLNIAHPMWTGHGIIPGSYWAHINYNARQRDIPVSVTIQDLDELFQKQCGRCALTGLQLKFGGGDRSNWSRATTASLDRINSKLGYSLDNIQFLHKEVNFMKHKLSQERFVELCDLVTKHAT